MTKTELIEIITEAEGLVKKIELDIKTTGINGSGKGIKDQSILYKTEANMALVKAREFIFWAEEAVIKASN